MVDYVTFGEIMLRLKPPGHERFFQTPSLQATFGGGEANVAVGLASMGLNSGYISAIPANPIGDACIAELRRHNVDTASIVRSGDRLGLYYLEAGSNQRPSVVIYDRAHSAVSEARAGSYKFSKVFSKAKWFHISGITPAISKQGAAVSIAAVRAAKKAGLTVSCDLNFRGKLWQYGKSAKEVMSDLLLYVDVAIGNEEDYQKSLGIKIDSSVNIDSGKVPAESYKPLTEEVLKQFPNLKKVAVTLRENFSADHNGWSAVINNRKNFFISQHYDMIDIVDRVGGGDAFSAGLIYGLNELVGDEQVVNLDEQALRFAVAAACLKHSIPGDLPLITAKEVTNLLEQGGSGRIVR